MPNYPGGYLIIDLKNINVELNEDPVSIDYEPWINVYGAAKKPVYICNYRIDGNPMPPTLLDNSSSLDDACRAVIGIGTNTSITLSINLGMLDTNQVTIEVAN